MNTYGTVAPEDPAERDRIIDAALRAVVLAVADRYTVTAPAAVIPRPGRKAS